MDRSESHYSGACPIHNHNCTLVCPKIGKISSFYIKKMIISNCGFSVKLTCGSYENRNKRRNL